MKVRLFIVSISVAACVSFAAPEKATTDVSGSFWLKGIDAVHNGKTDTALFYLHKAFSQGISDDSLYYLWAEIYLYKGDLDTALALNYAAKADSGGGLARQVLQQRYALFSSLGWSAEARQVLKLLDSGSSRLLRRLIPELNLNCSGGGYYENSAVDRRYPYPRGNDSTARLTNGSGAALLRFGWRLPVGRSQKLQIGGKFRYAGSRFSLPENSVKGTDSADASAGAYVKYSMFFDKLSAGYAFSRKRDFLKNATFVHEVNAGAALLTETWLGSLDLGLQWEYPLRRNYYYFMIFGDHAIDKKNTLGFSFVFSGLAEERLHLQDKVNFLYADNGSVFSDSTYSTPLRSTLELLAAYDTLRWEYTVPMSYWSVNPQLRYEHQLTKKIAFGITGTYSLSWYPEKYAWYDLRYPSGTEPQNIGIMNPLTKEEKFLAVNRNDRQFYWVRSIRSIDKVVLDALPVVFHKERRIDQAISLGLSVKSSLGRFGDVILDATMRRNFSTLMKSAPIDIQRMYGSLMLTWFFRFKPDSGL